MPPAFQDVYDALAARPAELAAAGAALLVVAWTLSWRLTRTVVTIAHEGGHAVVAVLVGRGLTGIRLHTDTSGVTHSTGAGRGPGVVLMFLAGYVFPPLLGLGGAALVAAGHTAVLLWLGVGLLVATLVYIRNLFGAFAVLVTGGVLGGVAVLAPANWQAGFAAALCWFLLFGGLRAVRELARSRRRRRTSTSDADQLAAITGVPGGMWTGLFALIGTAALLGAGWIVFV
ncbi:M50 family metallopeptidase [Pseudonocardia ailaonensis]|uniref:M50 family metallopeptidase n=1 Tax=Pseudonocardia ailaonensis TaxID=367279 RepID=A0ABN2N2C6_9PSEU